MTPMTPMLGKSEDMYFSMYHLPGCDMGSKHQAWPWRIMRSRPARNGATTAVPGAFRGRTGRKLDIHQPTVPPIEGQEGETMTQRL